MDLLSLRYLGIFWVNDKEFLAIIHRLVEEKKDIQKRLDIVEEILHSYIPLIENKEEK